MAPADVAVLVVLVVSFAAFVTAHLALSLALAMRPPRWQGPVALIVAPLAPFWGLKAGLRKRAVAWLVSVAVYAVARVVAAIIA